MMYLPEGLLSKTPENMNALKSIATLKDAAQNQRILESTAILCDNDHNLIVDLGDLKGIIPRNEGAIGIAEGTTRDIAMISRVNKPVCFVITEFRDDGTVLLSRKRAQELCRKHYINHLNAGDVIRAITTHFEPFGCFVDIGCGVASLIPIDAISVSRISHPKDRFKTGQEIFVIVKSIEPNGRICLSHKELLGTWEENVSNFSAGETVGGIVRSVEPYGIFVELTPNLAGLAEYKPDVCVGQNASVYIKSLIPEKMKVKLIIVDSFDDTRAPIPLQYYITQGNMQEWRYSPDVCNKLIETKFTGDITCCNYPTFGD